MNRFYRHSKATEALARQLKPADIFNWLMTDGYFPESYVLPPCFHVSQYPKYSVKAPTTSKKGPPKISQVCEVHFPKTELTDRTFGIIDPEIHNEMALEIAQHWDDLLALLFDPRKRIHSYSFPVPLSNKTPGQVGTLRAGRMIYEWIEMAENDLVEEAYAFKYLVRSDIKNFYPSIYTHSIAWALHGKPTIRAGNNRHNLSFLGNRLDKLFQNANDGCTNGVPIGPVVSDLVGEIVLAAVDLNISQQQNGGDVLGIRFKDDYRFLCKTEDAAKKVIKTLQAELKNYNLLLNEEKTCVVELPEGIFRDWVSKYYAVAPVKKQMLSFKEFKEFFLAVLRIDKESPGTGVIDRFISDIVTKKYAPRIPTSKRHLKKIISLLLLLADRRIKSLPRILGVLEAMMIKEPAQCSKVLEEYLNKLLKDLSKTESNNRYVISWILYFLKSNKLKVRPGKTFRDPILRSIQANRNIFFSKGAGYGLFRGVQKARKTGTLLKHLDVFKTA